MGLSYKGIIPYLTYLTYTDHWFVPNLDEQVPVVACATIRFYLVTSVELEIHPSQLTNNCANIVVKFLPLREISLNSRPLVKRAIAFSCDGELAVAADDSVHVYVPEFPDLSQRRKQKERLLATIQTNGSAATNGKAQEKKRSQKDGNSTDEDDDDTSQYGTLRAQYSEGSKHMPVSYPPLDPRINRELFTAVGLPFPYEAARNAAVGDGDGGASDSDPDEEMDSDSDRSDDDEDGDIGSNSSNRPFGAGYGPITGVGSSMNHVVCIGWSPSGLNINRRPVLAILTGAGTLAMYGDGNMADNILPRANEGMLQRRELNSWIVLWGVGERLLVPGQPSQICENIRGFAWAREIGPGQALLAVITDTREVAILSVQSIFRPDETKRKGNLSTTLGPKENLIWLVQEITRFKALGPHPKGNVSLDVSYIQISRARDGLLIKYLWTTGYGY